MIEVDDLRKIPDVEKVWPDGSDGGFKLVFKAKVKGELDALKVLRIARGENVDDVTINRLKREIELLGSVSSDYLPKLGHLPIYRFKKKDDTFVIYSEKFIEGSDVQELITKGFFKNKKMLIKLSLEVMRAIKAYWDHDQIVHRDVKPANIRFSNDSKKFILLDAGIAYIRNKTSLTSTGQGSPRTPAYTSPEQIKNDRNLSFRTDLFCLGVVMHEATTNTHPFYQSGMKISEINESILNKNPTELHRLDPKIPVEFSSIVSQMLAKRPHQRPNNLSSIINRLEKL